MRVISGLLALTSLAVGCGELEPASATTDGGASSSSSSSSSSSGGSSGTPPAPPSSPSTCANAKRCYTFDGDAGAPSFSFDSQLVDHSGTLALLTDQPHSAPRSLVTKVLGSGVVEAGSAMGITRIGKPPSRISTSFVMKVLAYDPQGDPSAHFLSLRCTGSSADQIYLKLSDATHLGIKQVPTSGPDATSPMPGTMTAWSQFQVDFDAATNGGYKVSVSYLGAPYFAAQPPSLPFGCTDLELLHGVEPSALNSSTAHYELAFDDILVNWQ